jgi:hypothetical protein
MLIGGPPFCGLAVPSIENPLSVCKFFILSVNIFHISLPSHFINYCKYRLLSLGLVLALTAQY